VRRFVLPAFLSANDELNELLNTYPTALSQSDSTAMRRARRSALYILILAIALWLAALIIVLA
jgi:hypothetical protein